MRGRNVTYKLGNQKQAYFPTSLDYSYGKTPEHMYSKLYLSTQMLYAVLSKVTQNT